MQAFDWIDSHFLLPTYNLDLDWPWQSVCIPWLTLPWWEPGETIQSLWVYFDGSSAASKQEAGCGVCAFVFNGTWKWAGALSAGLEPGTTSYKAEACGAALATKFIFDLLKIALHSQPPEIWLCYDSTSVGEQVMGNWNANQSPQLLASIRGIALLIETRFQVVIQHCHIYGHSGEPGNEIVDTLAVQAGKGHALTDAETFLTKLLQPEFSAALAWTWFPFRQDIPLLWQDTHLVLPQKPATTPSSQVFAFQPEAPSRHSCNLTLCLATLNVLTLKGVNSKQFGLQGLSRQTSILRQLHEAGANIFALQETRQQKQTMTVDSNFVLITSSANKQGHFGLMVGFDRTRPHGVVRDDTGMDVPVTFHPTHLAILHAGPRQLIIKVSTPALKCLIMAGHAPHSGASQEDVEHWWTEFSSHVPSSLAHWHRFVLVDANCRLGHFPSECVGTWQPEKDTRHSEAFHDFLRNENVWLPATFQESQVGEAGTWRHSNGQWYRGDFVALPQQLLCSSCKAYVSSLVDASLAKEDHRAAFVGIEACYDIFSRYRHKRSEAPFDEEALLENIEKYPAVLAHQLQTVTTPAWNVDVHTHVEHLSHHVTGALQTIYAPPAKKPRKTTMSEATWELVQRKRTVRNGLAALNQQQTWSLLRVCWTAWRDAPLHIDYLIEFDAILTNLDILIAKDLHEFRSLGRLVSSALRADDVMFFSALAQDAADFLGPGQARQLWKVVRRSLPQFKQRRARAPPICLCNTWKINGCLTFTSWNVGRLSCLPLWLRPVTSFRLNNYHQQALPFLWMNSPI